MPLFRTDNEFAAELSNQTVHGVMHLAWVDRGEGRYQRWSMAAAIGMFLAKVRNRAQAWSARPMLDE